MHDDQFKKLLAHRRLSWEGYRRVRKGVKKKIARHMRAIGCEGRMTAYLHVLAADPLKRRECERLLTVSISRFFRDRQVWTALKQWLPAVSARLDGPEFRVWAAGCACGEEVYSFKMVWEEIDWAPATKPGLSLVATDINPDCLERARKGRYPESSLKEVPRHYRKTYFNPPRHARRFEVKEWLKPGIVWRLRDLEDAPPGDHYHLVFLRNSVLTYYAGHRRISALSRILSVLPPGGVLVVGAGEALPESFSGRFQLGPHKDILVFRP